jgi:hypothetical protein
LHDDYEGKSSETEDKGDEHSLNHCWALQKCLQLAALKSFFCTDNTDEHEKQNILNPEL